MLRLTAAAAALAAAAACAGPAPRPVMVFAAASLQELGAEASALFEAQTGRRVELSFGASSALARQLSEGAPAAVFLSADPKWAAEVAGLARKDWLSNRLVCVVLKEAPDPDLRMLRSLALAAPEVPAGRYAREALDRLGIPLPERVIYGSSVRDTLAKVSAGGAEAGLVYATDAAVDPSLRAAFELPEAAQPRITYVAALLSEDGRAFYDFLSRPAVRAAAQRRGFLPR